MASVTLKGNPINLSGSMPGVGDAAPDFKIVKNDMSEAGLNDFEGKVKVLVGVPSLDTPVCAKETKEFNEKMGTLGDAVVVVISGDLPFAMKRYCAAEGVDNVVTGSQYRDMSFSKAYGVHMADGPLQDLVARSIFVVGKDNKVAYSELVPEIAQEPDYDAALDAVKKLV